MERSPFRPITLAATLLATLPALPLPAQQPLTLPPALLAAYSWRNLGPDRGGRSIAASGVTGRPQEAYFGATGGGLWKTTDGGENWHPVTDFQITSSSIGAVAVAETDPDLVFIGTGETCIRGNILPGDGVYRSRDAGATWEHVGFRDSHGISKIRIHPTDPAIVYVASFGKYGVPSEERGVFRSTDGGDSWELINDERRIRQRAFYYTHVFADHHDQDVVYVQNTSFFHSSDGGATYEVINNGTHGDFHDFWIDPDDPAHVVVANDGGGAVSFTTGSRQPADKPSRHSTGDASGLDRFALRCSSGE